MRIQLITKIDLNQFMLLNHAIVDDYLPTRSIQITKPIANESERSDLKKEKKKFECQINAGDIWQIRNNIFVSRYYDDL